LGKPVKSIIGREKFRCDISRKTTIKRTRQPTKKTSIFQGTHKPRKEGGGFQSKPDLSTNGGAVGGHLVWGTTLKGKGEHQRPKKKTSRLVVSLKWVRKPKEKKRDARNGRGESRDANRKTTFTIGAPTVPP